ncbi:LOW QUALITY PROTEIN: uncharacterized protein LOC129594327 [Paramacrobiotus metropolitanus]|uniref:LOW QUALITY PROTEIN: uncharacterized protein LOC129594327 n=1 Tax=Paramacrobiotus metropolitanus TaxID=2943436 RepID=UPI0024460075|nr:LOW QUALITY PROTEIN: uncharacterized protein LOC129594327 [Paramacrobiotus metropolitanus]
MMHNEAPYLMEWIEFHRLQGVDHFVLYNYFGSDLIEYTPMYYENTGIVDLVEVLPARFFGQDPKRVKDLADYLQNKEWSMVDCYVRSGKQSDWLLMLDVGHFVYSTEYETIGSFLLEMALSQKPRDDDFAGEFRHDEPFSAVRIPTVRFGTSGQIGKFRTWLSPNSYTGSVDLLYEPYNDTANIYPMVIETNTHRVPHRELDGNYTDLPVCTETQENAVSLGLCSDSSTVTLVRADRFCVKDNMTECLKPTIHFIWPELPVLASGQPRMAITGARPEIGVFDFRKNKTFEALDASWYSLIEDDFKKKTYLEAVRRRIMDTKPRIFWKWAGNAERMPY